MSRASIFSKIKAALEPVEPKTEYPEYDASIAISDNRISDDSPRAAFSRNFTAVSGRVMDSASELVAFLKKAGHNCGYCDPELMPVLGQALADAGLEVHADYQRAEYDKYAFGITRATAAIAESGSLIIDDTKTSDRLAALSPWVHVAILREDEIHRSIPDALAALGPSRNTIFVTGPSKTADVEGILIEGVHGPGEQIAFFI